MRKSTRVVSSGEAVSYDSDSKPTINPSFAAAIRSEGCETRRLGQSEPVKYWETIADRLHAEGWSYGTAEHLTEHGLLYCVDAHRDGERFIVKADDLLTAFFSLERDPIATKGANGNATRQSVA